jgi:hypothetical protein
MGAGGAHPLQLGFAAGAEDQPGTLGAGLVGQGLADAGAGSGDPHHFAL